MALLSLCFSCQGSRPDERHASVMKQPLEQNVDTNDFDPYFIESRAISSPYGPESITRNIIQDRKGNIWLATWEGIIMYDGKSFTNFMNRDGLRRYHTFALHEDRNGNIWVGTIGAGVYFFDGKGFANYTMEDGLTSDRIGCIYEDKAGNIWVGTDGGLSLYNPENQNQGGNGLSFLKFTTDDGLPDNDINSIIEDRSGRFWIGARGEACYFDPEANFRPGGQLSFSRIPHNEGQTFINVRCILEDQKGNIWFGGNDGLLRYSPGVDRKAIDPDAITRYTSAFTGYMHEDRKGNIWTSSVSENDREAWVLSRYNENSLANAQISPDRIYEKIGMFFGIMEDRDGHIWLGTHHGACRYDGESIDCFRESGARE